MYNTFLSFAGSIASIIGFFITIYVGLSVRRIKKSYLNKARLPHLLKDLKMYTSDLSKLFSDFEENRSEISIAINRIEATLKNIKHKVGTHDLPELKNNLKDIKELKKDTSQDKTWRLYESLAGTITSFENFNRDSEWTRS